MKKTVSFRARAVAVLLSVALLSPLGASVAVAETELIIGGSAPVGSLIDRANRRFADLVTDRSGGDLKVNFIAGEQLGSDIQVIEQMMQGSVHIYCDVLAWYANWVKDFAILNWGFTFDDNDHVQRFLDSDIFASLAEQLRENQGLRILAAAPTEPRVLFAKKPVNSPADLSGLKMRVPEIRTYLLLWETLGTSPSKVAWSEVFLGLKTGVIEAAEGPVSAAYAQKFHQAAANLMRTDHLVSTYHITMNEAIFQSLDADKQKLLLAAATEVAAWARAQAEADVEDIVGKMQAEGTNVVKVDPAPFAEKALAGVSAMEADGEWSGGLWRQIRDLR